MPWRQAEVPSKDLKKLKALYKDFQKKHIKKPSLERLTATKKTNKLPNTLNKTRKTTSTRRKPTNEEKLPLFPSKPFPPQNRQRSDAPDVQMPRSQDARSTGRNLGFARPRWQDNAGEKPVIGIILIGLTEEKLMLVIFFIFMFDLGNTFFFSELDV